MTQQHGDSDRGLSMVGGASDALEAAGLEHWFFGGWAVDLWVGRITRPHDDIDVLVWRRDEALVDEALQGAGGSTRRLLRTWSAPTTPATATSSRSRLWCPAQREASSFRSRSSRSRCRADPWPTHAGRCTASRREF